MIRHNGSQERRNVDIGRLEETLRETSNYLVRAARIRRIPVTTYLMEHLEGRDSGSRNGLTLQDFAQYVAHGDSQGITDYVAGWILKTFKERGYSDNMYPVFEPFSLQDPNDR